MYRKPRRKNISKSVDTNERKFEFSNQSDQYVTVWVPRSHGCWHPTWLYPYRDSGILNFLEKEGLFIFTKAIGYFTMYMDNRSGSYRLIKETPSREIEGHSKIAEIRSMPYDEVKDIIVIIDPEGNVDFTNRNI
jgi:hypothetical protein